MIFGGLGEDLVLGGDGDDVLSGNTINFFGPSVPNTDGEVDVIRGLDDFDTCVKSDHDHDVADCESVIVQN